MIFNIYVFQSLASFLFSIGIALFLLHAGLRTVINRRVFFFVLTGINHMIFEIITRTTENVDIALIARRIIGMNTTLMNVSLVMLGLAMLSKKYPKWIEYLVWGVAGIFFVLNITPLVVVSNYQAYWGYNWDTGSAGFAFMIFNLVYFFGSIYLMFRGYFDAKNSQAKKQYAIIAWGFAITFLPAGFTDIIFPQYDIQIQPIGTMMFIITALLFAYATVRYKLFIVEPVLEDSLSAAKQKFFLKPGHSYIATGGGKKGAGLNPFIDQVMGGKMGLYITRDNPTIVRQDTPLKKTPMIWLTEVSGENTIDPSRIEELNYAITKFLDTADNSVVLLEGIAYLINYSDFNLILRFLRTLKDTVSTKNASLMIAVDPKNFDEKDFSLMKDEFESI